MTAAFDTLGATLDLEKAGMDRMQAEAFASVVRAGQGELATKGDVDALRKDLGALENRMIAALYRALWMQASRIVVAIITLASVALGLARTLGTP
ncbi:MAG: hypothetical protein OXU19_11755 [bacterium]|nr:hypothetical protein [bacterium]MDE0242475.1 hypothetical protein [bacterium]MDE0416266.1 hypothetical protein [bacterium]